MKTVQFLIFSVAAAAASSCVFAQTTTTFNSVPSRIVGQPILQQVGTLTAVSPNLVEGRELFLPQAVAVDTSASPPILYVSDYGNNRVLAWKNATAFNNGDFADKVIGQRDFISVNPQGPGRDLTVGLFAPTGLAVDKRGNLYVVDTGNNRILRYPTPLLQTGDLLAADLVIGQKDFNGRNPNEGQQKPTERSLFFSSNSFFLVGLAFDAQGNLWVTDPGNNRVLRFPASALGDNPSNEPAADLVLGQSDFVTSTLPPNPTTPPTPSQQLKNAVPSPSAVGIDPKGRVFVADGFARVDVFFPPFANGQPIARIMGVVPPTKQNPFPPRVSDSTLGLVDPGSGRIFGVPNGIFFIGNNPYVVDTPNARILGYDPVEQWPDEATAFSPPAKVVIGQPSFQAYQGNRALPQPTNQTFAGPQLGNNLLNISGPIAATFALNTLLVVDTGNQRVLSFPQRSGGTFDSATRVLGQLDFQYNSFNLIEGREFGFTQNTQTCSGLFVTSGSVVIDSNSNPPHMYVSDPLNNRVLGFTDYRKVNAGSKADLVIGQPDLLTALINFPSNDPNSTNAQGLYSPGGLAIDSNGDLFVADSCNSRVLRFPKPFDQPPGTGMESANLVIGQLSFSGQPIKDVSRQTMKSTYGIAFTFDGHLVVSDPIANRILFFRRPAGGDFQSGATANNVIGQPDFRTSQPTVLNSPRGLFLDPDDQLYVADTGNNRIAIFPNVPLSGDNPTPLLSITGLSAPFGVTVNQVTREVWVTNTNGNSLLRYPKYETLAGNPSPTAQFLSLGPVAVTLDPFGNPVAAEALANRVAFYFPAIDFTSSAGGVANRYSGNAANYFQRFAPGMLSSIFPFSGSRFGDQTVVNDKVPVPTTLGDIQVLVGGIPSPLLYVDGKQINFQVPSGIPIGSLQEFQVVRASTSQVLASFLFKIDPVSPGLFTANGTGTGQVAAINVADGTVNGPTHPAKAGSYITLYATGQGLVDNMPPDGQPAVGLIPTNGLVRVTIDGNFVPDDSIQFSGLAPGFVGLWQINVKIPDTARAGDLPVVVFIQSVGSARDQNGLLRQNTIRVTQ